MRSDNNERNIKIDTEVEHESIDLGYQGDNNTKGDIASDELKQQAGELLKAAGGLAGSFGKLAMEKSSKLKEKIEDEEFQAKTKESVKSFKATATKKATRATEKAKEKAKNASKNLEQKARSEKAKEKAKNASKNLEQKARSEKPKEKAKNASKNLEQKARSKKPKEKAVTEVAATPIHDKPKQEIKKDFAQNTADDSKKSGKIKTVRVATVNGNNKNGKTLGIIILIAVVVIAGVLALALGGDKSNEQNVSDEPVVEQNQEESVYDETSELKASEETEEPEAVNYSTNTIDTVKAGNAGKYSYKSSGSSYDKYCIIDFDEGYVYMFTYGDGNEDCEKIKIESGNLNDVLIITYHDGEDEWSNGLHFKYKDNPDHLVIQDNDGFETDFQPTNLTDALSIRVKLTIHEY